MDPLLSSIESSGKAGLSGLLSSLNAMLNGAAANPDVFAHFLQQNQSPPAPPAPPASPSSAASDQPGAQSDTTSSPDVQTQGTVSQNTDPSPSSSPQPANSGGTVLTLVRKVVSGLHQVLEQLNRGEKTKTNVTTGTGAGAGQSQSANSQTTPSKQTNKNSNSAVTDASADNQSSDGSGSVSAGTDTVDGNALTLAQLLAQLVTLTQAIVKKLEAAQSNAGTSTSAPTAVSGSDSTSPPQASDPANGTAHPWLNALMQLEIALTGKSGSSDPTSATGSDSGQSGTTDPSASAGSQTGNTDPLTQLLALIESIEQKLSPPASASQNSSTTGATLTASQTSSSQSLPPVDFSEIRKDLKTLMEALRNTVANGNAPDNTPSGSTPSNSQPAATPAATSGPVDPTGSDKAALTSIDNFFSLFSNKSDGTPGNFSPANPWGSPAANDPSVSANGRDGSTLDSDSDNGANFGNTNNASGAGINNTLPQIPDGVSPSGPYNFASQLSNMRAVNGGATGLPNVVDQVILQLNRGVKDGNDQMTIQLQPVDLGKINIKLEMLADNKVQGTVVADNPATLNLLLKDVRGLERALQEAGLRADSGSLQFSLGGQSGNPGNTSGQMAGNSGAGNSQDSGTSIGVPDNATDITPDPGETWYLTPGRVNFKV